MPYHPAPPEKIRDLPIAELGIEETRGAPRPWIFNREKERRRRRRERISRIRLFFSRLRPSRTTP